MKLQIKEVDFDLFVKFPWDDRPRGGFLTLDTSTGEFTAVVDSGQVWPESIHAWPVPCITATTANSMLDRLEGQAQSILDGSSCAVTIFENSYHYLTSTVGIISYRRAEDYLSLSSVDELRISAHTSDAQLEARAEEISALAAETGDRIEIVEVFEYLEKIRDRLREDSSPLAKAVLNMGTATHNTYFSEVRRRAVETATRLEIESDEDLVVVATAVLAMTAMSHGLLSYNAALHAINVGRIQLDDPDEPGLSLVYMTDLTDDPRIIGETYPRQESTYELARRISSEVTSEEILPLALQGELEFISAALAAERINTVRPINIENCIAILNDHRMDNGLDPIEPNPFIQVTHSKIARAHVRHYDDLWTRVPRRRPSLRHRR
jgi:hypothetical protein